MKYMTYIATYKSDSTGQQYMSIRDFDDQEAVETVRCNFDVIGAIDGLDLVKIKKIDLSEVKTVWQNHAIDQ